MTTTALPRPHRLIQETDEGLIVSEGRGWRDPLPGEFLDAGGGNFLSLNSETAAVAWLKGFWAGVLVVGFAVAVIAGVVAEAVRQ